VANYVMPAAEVLSLIRELDTQSVDVCLGGGWSVDALLGEQTREHSDLDIWSASPDLEGLFRVIAARGVDRIHPWPGDRPWNFVLHDGKSIRVDLHLYENMADGSIHYGSVLDPFILPRAALSYQGVIDGVPIRCEDPSWAVSFHVGYVPRPSDRHDVLGLCKQYDIALPQDYR